MSAGSLTKAQQETIVGEGLALGLLAVGVVAVTSGKQAVEFAFGRAWRSWTHRSKFPQVRMEIARNDVLRIMRDSERRRGSALAYWATGGAWYEPVQRADWSVEEDGEVLGENSGIPFAQWVALAEAIVAELKDDQVRRRDG
ncbi:hypothetical protein DMP15_18595 [Pseudonocardia sp. UM4_GMWB1]|uniref:hypothetical protein n=1 Tax=Pseudonocardia sp. UM4_GMWB1 TaxID=2212989 RepID=UPI00307E60D9